MQGDGNVEDEDQERREKRFKLTASGLVKCGQAGKRHGMIKRTKKQIRNKRGTTVMSPQDAKIVKKFLPNGL
jgi:large subunit ribosomal protein L35